MFAVSRQAWLPVAIMAVLSGCVPRSELENAQRETAAARERIEQLERQRVPRADFEAARAAAAAATAKTAALQHELQEARSQVAAQEELRAVELAARQPGPRALAQLQPGDIAKGSYALSNGTLVYSPDTVLKLGTDFQISSPTGLMVSDPGRKIVGGELNINAKGLVLETDDGLLTAHQDGSVTFTGNSLTMKVADEKSAPPNQTNQPQPPATGAGAPTAPDTQETPRP